ncbi:hypothetical protein ACWGID_40085 [Kribbella sp. NPDC054772]
MQHRAHQLTPYGLPIGALGWRDLLQPILYDGLCQLIEVHHRRPLMKPPHQLLPVHGRARDLLNQVVGRRVRTGLKRVVERHGRVPGHPVEGMEVRRGPDLRDTLVQPLRLRRLDGIGLARRTHRHTRVRGPVENLFQGARLPFGLGRRLLCQALAKDRLVDTDRAGLVVEAAVAARCVQLAVPSVDAGRSELSRQVVQPSELAVRR